MFIFFKQINAHYNILPYLFTCCGHEFVIHVAILTMRKI